MLEKLSNIKIKLAYVLGLGMALIVGTTASAVVMAAIPDTAGVIHGCYKSNGGLTVIDSATTSCASGTTALNWNQTGPAGPQGPAGSGGAVAYAHLVYGFPVGTLDANFSSNVTLLASYTSSTGSDATFYCLQVNAQIKGAILSLLEQPPTTGVRYTIQGYSNFDSFEGSAFPACPTGTNAKIAMDETTTLNILFY